MPRDTAAPRVVALHLPDFPLQRLLRARAPGCGGSPAAAAGGGRPIAVFEEGRVVACDAAARADGVRRGATAPEALAACGRLEVVPVDRAADRAALRALAEVLLSLAPAVEVAPPDALLLDAGAAALLGRRDAGSRRAAQDSGERVLAARAISAAEEMGYVARAAVADGRAPARALARHARGETGGGHAGTPATLAGPAGILQVPPGETALALAPLPLQALGLPPAVVARLSAVGVRDAGGLARLPQGTLAHRFGEEGIAAARLARGEDAAPLVAFTPETLPEEGIDLEAPAESAEPLLFALKRLADRVAARLAGRGLGASRLKLVLKLDPRGEERVLVPLARPSAVASGWLAPLKEHLFSLRLPGAVTGLRLLAVEVAVVAAEQLAFGDRPEAMAALEGVLARLSVRLGDGAVFAAEPVERYRPEAAYRPAPYRPNATSPRSPDPGAAGGEGPGERGDPSSLAGPRPTRLLSAPELVVAEGEGGRLTAIRVGGRDRAVLSFEGPERLRGEWWSSPFDRDYYRVRLEGLGDCWLYRNGADGRLWLHGFFD